MGSNVIKVDFRSRSVAGVKPPSDKVKQYLLQEMKDQGYTPTGEVKENYDNSSGMWLLRLPCYSPLSRRPIDMVFWYKGDEAKFAYAAEPGEEAVLSEAQAVV